MRHVSEKSAAAVSASSTGLKRWLDALLYSSGLVAAAATSLTWATFLFWQVHIPFRLALLIFTATLFLYNIDSVLPYKFRQQAVLSGRKLWMIQHRRELFGLALVSLAVAAVLFWVDGWRHLTLFLGHLAAISLLYSFPIVKLRGRWRALRDFPLLKVFLIAYVWAAITVWVPALYLNKALTAPVVLVLFGRRFLFILALAFVFDIRDYTKDLLSGTRTFPGIFGIRAAKILALLCLAASSLLIPQGITSAHLLVLTVPTLLTSLIVWFADETRPDYYFALLADGIMVVQFLAVYWIA
ncbi:UbiA family prenyltransferase [Hymenobacter cellulosivorans]|uniref:UbiA family prenyltransferase n=1 Tax=Hymenobacter cellulosivorans TaxID=2932249 RepID=A0ABY4FEV2_9BACT|nr:UbiA family prenyltransferase [Hymenobacter cellulosivorans]UOQ54479.1 UbiA family prenyltransferase [Hymenobacter cellulosivorans]